MESFTYEFSFFIIISLYEAFFSEICSKREYEIGNIPPRTKQRIIAVHYLRLFEHETNDSDSPQMLSHRVSYKIEKGFRVIFRDPLTHNRALHKRIFHYTELFFMSEKGPFRSLCIMCFTVFVFLVFYFTSCFNPKINVVP